MKKLALLSVFDKTGIVDFARALRALDFTIIASGGTFRELIGADARMRNSGASSGPKIMIEPIDVAAITGLGPVLGHRVVTLHPKIHGGLLATEEMKAEMKRLDIPWIDLVCVDLYPLEDAIAAEDATLESVTEQTDIGGPALLRSAAKGRRIVICDSNLRAEVLERLRREVKEPGKGITDLFRLRLATEAERCVAEYVIASARFLADREFALRQIQETNFA